MIKPQDVLSALQQQLGDKTPGFAKAAQEDLHHTLKLMVSAALARLDLVSREEFDIQADLLARTQQRVAELEAAMAALESQQP